MRRILDFINKNKGVLLAILIVIAISAIIIIWLTSGDDKQAPNNNFLIEVPLSTEVKHAVTIDREKYVQLPKELGIYKIVKTDNRALINNFLVKIGKNNMNIAFSDPDFVSWEKDNEYVEYITNYSSLKFYFEDTVQLVFNNPVTDDASAQRFVELFYRNYLNKDYEFTNVKVTQEGTMKKIEASRKIGDLPIYTMGYDVRTDLLYIDNNSNLKSGLLTIVEVEAEPADTIPLVDITNLQNVLRNSEYPKVVYEGYSEELIEYASRNEDGTEIPDYGDNLIAKTLQATSVADKVGLVYFYSDNSLTYLVPSYQIYSTGRVEYNSKTFPIPLLIYANALDPERVFISNE